MFKQIPAESMRYLLMCAVGGIVFVAVAVYPTERSIQALDARIGVLGFQIEKQKSLLPVYTELNHLLDSSKVPELPVPGPGTYPRDRIDQVSSTFGGMVQETGLSIVSVVPDIYSFTRNSSLLPVRIVTRGRFSDFQRFLTRLGSAPAIVEIEEVGVKQVPGSREFDAKVVFAIGD